MSRLPAAPSGDQRAIAGVRGRGLLRCGADVVELGEQLQVRLFRVVLCGVTGSGIISIALLPPALWPRTLPAAGIAAIVSAGAVMALRWPKPVLLAVRHRVLGQCAPGVIGALLLLVGPSTSSSWSPSPLWFLALAGIFLTAVVGTTRQAVATSLLAAGLCLTATFVHAGSSFPSHDVRAASFAFELVLDGVATRGVIAGLTRFVLELNRFQTPAADVPPPLKVPNVTDAVPTRATRGRAVRRIRGLLPHARSRLTVRQLEVVLLLRDGLRQGEIAACLAISKRQVERHLADAQRRVAAKTPAELVAMLVQGGLAPATGARTAVSSSLWP